MPVLPSAKKALRRDQRRESINKPVRSRMKKALRQAREKPTKKNSDAAYSAVDRAAKKGVIHSNKAARIKSRLQKFIKSKKSSS